MKFDSMRAWKQASASVSANRDVLLAIAGVCFLLPSLALDLFFPQPEPTAGMDEKAIMELASNYYVSILPALIPILVLQALGTLSLVVLLTDKSRPTVAQALRAGARCILPYLLAQLMIGLFAGLFGGTLIALFSLTGTGALVGIGMALVLAMIAVIAVRTSITAPVIVAERVTNPLDALWRSIAVTRGNGGRIFVFYALVLVALFVIAMIVGLVVGIPLGLLGAPEATRIVTALVSATVNAVMGLYFVAIIAAVHAQLAGGAAADGESSV